MADREPAGRKKAEISEATRTALLEMAQEMFAEYGYAGTATEEVVRRAGVTRGALYYHFKNKEGLFRAVVEEVERATAERIALAALAETGPWNQLVAGCMAFLDLSADPAVQRISLLDAPSVLGWETYREVDLRYGFGLLKGGLMGAMDAGAIVARPPDAVAHMVLGALLEGAMFIARAADTEAARARAGEAILLLLGGLRSPESP